MKKIILFIIITLAAIRLASAQKSDSTNIGYQKGNTTFSVGYGWGVIIPENAFQSYQNVDYHFGPIYLKVERAIDKYVSLGLNIAYVELRQSNDHDYGSINVAYELQSKYSSYSALLRLNVHPIPNRRADLYVGTGLGYRQFTNYVTLLSTTSTYDQNTNTFISEQTLIDYTEGNGSVGWEGTIGLNYHISTQMTFYGEVGFAKSAAQLGMTFKF